MNFHFFNLNIEMQVPALLGEEPGEGCYLTAIIKWWSHKIVIVRKRRLKKVGISIILQIK